MLKKVIYTILFFIGISYSYAQDFSNLWEGHFSFLNIRDITEGNDKLYVAAENSIFVYNESNGEITTITTINGLSGEAISNIHYSESHQLLLVGYESGLIKIVNEIEDNVLTIVDIIEKQNIAPNKKKINYFNEHENVVFISTDYGISVFNLVDLEFGDTYYIGNGGSQITVKQTAIHNNYIFAACGDNSGMRRASLDATNLIEFQAWNQIVPGNFEGIQVVGDRLYTLRLNKVVYEVINNTALVELATYPTLPLKFRGFNNILAVTREDLVYTYDSDFNLIGEFGDFPDNEMTYSSAIMTDDFVYLGTDNNGLLRTSVSEPLSYSVVYSEGPLKNNVFSVEAGSRTVFITYGDYTPSYNPSPGRRYGFSYYIDNQWKNISYDNIFNTFGQHVYNLNDISINPFNPSQVFISSFAHGIVVLDLNNEEEILSGIFNQTNSGLESLFVPSAPDFVSIRVSGTNFDSQGVLWSLTAKVDSPLKSYDPNTGQWQSFSFSEIIQDALNDEAGFSDVEISNDGTKWIGARRFGLIGYNTNENRIKNISDEVLHGLPHTDVKALAIDSSNQLWIGTTKGLRILFNTGSFFDDDTVTTFPIIILEDGIPRELLEQQYITDIKVDGANNKWVSTLGAGVFYFTSDGQETIYHFTKDNSPLPSNNINDMSIDFANGKIFIATDKGMVSFGSGGSKPQETLENAYAYPNPVRPNFNMVDEKIKIKDISENCNVKITDIEGNLVAEAESNTNLRYRGYNLEIDGGTAYWNGKNLANNTVATGVYLVMLTDLDTQETNVLKLMVVR